MAVAFDPETLATLGVGKIPPPVTGGLAHPTATVRRRSASWASHLERPPGLSRWPTTGSSRKHPGPSPGLRALVRHDRALRGHRRAPVHGQPAEASRSRNRPFIENFEWRSRGRHAVRRDRSPRGAHVGDWHGARRSSPSTTSTPSRTATTSSWTSAPTRPRRSSRRSGSQQLRAGEPPVDSYLRALPAGRRRRGRATAAGRRSLELPRIDYGRVNGPALPLRLGAGARRLRRHRREGGRDDGRDPRPGATASPASRVSSAARPRARRTTGCCSPSSWSRAGASRWSCSMRRRLRSWRAPGSPPRPVRLPRPVQQGLTYLSSS